MEKVVPTRPHRALALRLWSHDDVVHVVHVVLVPWDGQGVPRWDIHLGNLWGNYFCGGGFPEIQGFDSFLTTKTYGYIYIYMYSHELVVMEI